jgi:hypothetical protein
VRKNEIKRFLEDALVQLDEEHRLVFLLRDVEGLSVKEISVAIGLIEANTNLRLLRARLQLRELLTRAFADPCSCKTRLPIKSFPDSVSLLGRSSGRDPTKLAHGAERSSQFETLGVV